jgi:hypothetical protein
MAPGVTYKHIWFECIDTHTCMYVIYVWHWHTYQWYMHVPKTVVSMSLKQWSISQKHSSILSKIELSEEIVPPLFFVHRGAWYRDIWHTYIWYVHLMYTYDIHTAYICVYTKTRIYIYLFENAAVKGRDELPLQVRRRARYVPPPPLICVVCVCVCVCVCVYGGVGCRV